MRQGSNPKRGRGRNNGRKPSPVRSNVHDSNGPNIRVRGNAYQVMEKYLAMARDAAASGDRIAAENYYQHAEHYFRTLNASGSNGSGDRHHHHHQHMHTPSDPMGDDGDGDEDMNGGRMNAVERPVAGNAGAIRAAEQPRVDPSQMEQPRTDLAPAPMPAGTPQPVDGRGQGDQEPRRRGPNGRRRPGPQDGHGTRPARDPRSISPGSPAEAATSDAGSADTDTPTET